MGLVPRNPSSRDETIAEVVIDAANKTSPWAPGSAKRFISDVYETVCDLGRDDGVSLPEFKDILWRLHKGGRITLARADLVAAMPERKVAASQIARNGAEFHFIVTAAKNAASPSDVEFSTFLAKTRRRAADREAEARAALKVSPALILTSGDFSELVIVSGDTHPGQPPLRVTTFLVDGPWGHENYKTMDEVAFEIARRSWKEMRAADDHEVIEWTSTPEFVRGSKRVAYVQAANALRYWAGRQGYQSAEYARIEKLLGKTNAMDEADIDEAIEILERELAKVSGSGLVENPPWVTKVLADSYEAMESAVPPAWLPKLSDVGATRDKLTARMREYGCGAYGCVLPTLDPEIVLKITTDDTETEFAEQFSHTLASPIVVEYHHVLRLPKKRAGRNVTLLWRESATAVGDLGSELGTDALELVSQQHAAAQTVLKIIVAGSGEIGDSISAWLYACEQMAEVPEIEMLARGMITVFMQQRIFFGDVHEGNLGRVYRDGKPVWVITDPGNVVVFRR